MNATLNKEWMLRFPFRPLHWVTGLEAERAFNIDGLRCSIQAEKPELVLRVQPFATEADALEFMPRIWGALARLSIELKTGFVAEMQPDKTVMASDPVVAAAHIEAATGRPNTGPVHGIASANRPSVIPIGMNILQANVLDATATVTWPAEKYVSAFVEAMHQVRDGNLYADDKVRTAIELLSGIQRESTTRSKFLTCVMALEVLTMPVLRHDLVLQLLDQVDVEADLLLQAQHLDSDAWHAIDSLRNELKHKRTASLRSSMREMALREMADLPSEERISRSKELVWAYDQRSILVHRGDLPQQELSRAFRIAYRALTDILERRCGIVTP